MDVIGKQEVLKHLISRKDFIDKMRDYFTAKEIIEIVTYCKDVNSNTPKIMDNVNDFIMDVEEDETILSISWDSDAWGAGGNGYIGFDLVFGIVRMSSSDYSDSHVEIFNKDTFFPWAIESLIAPYIDIYSSIYTKEEIITKYVEKLDVEEETELTINNTEVRYFN